ncbi:MAG: tetratricopeptide repeat protein [Deltaproteobacteria bacterium]|nr:tetratricopeptide repeat protein [Deltaproteobacteria bacterium]
MNSRLRSALTVAVAVALAVSVQGCSLGGAKNAATGKKSAKASQQAGAKRAGKPVDESGGYAALSDWEAFERTRRSLGAEIDRRAKALRGGAVGNLAAELASLRMSAKAPVLIDKGSLDGAVELLERAVSMYGGNGYAYLFLAYVHHVEGRPDQAAGFLSSARRYLPADKGVRGETEGLARSIRASGPSAGGSAPAPG